MKKLLVWVMATAILLGSIQKDKDEPETIGVIRADVVSLNGQKILFIDYGGDIYQIHNLTTFSAPLVITVEISDQGEPGIARVCDDLGCITLPMENNITTYHSDVNTHRSK